MIVPDDELPLLRPEQIARLEAIIKYRFRDHDNAFLCEALQIIAPSQTRITRINGRKFTGDNQKLAIIGDAVMAVVVAEYWFSDKNSIRGLFLYPAFSCQ